MKPVNQTLLVVGLGCAALAGCASSPDRASNASVISPSGYVDGRSGNWVSNAECGGLVGGSYQRCMNGRRGSSNISPSGAEVNGNESGTSSSGAYSGGPDHG